MGWGPISADVDEYVNSVKLPIIAIRFPPGTQSPNLVERGQKKLFMCYNPNRHSTTADSS